MKYRAKRHLFLRVYSEDQAADAVAILNREGIIDSVARHNARHKPFFETVIIGEQKGSEPNSSLHRGIWAYDLYHVLANEFGTKNVVIGYDGVPYDQAYQEEAEAIKAYQGTVERGKQAAAEKMVKIAEYDELYRALRLSIKEEKIMPFVREITLNRIGDGLELIHTDLQAIAAKIGADAASELQRDLLAEQQEQM